MIAWFKTFVPLQTFQFCINNRFSGGSNFSEDVLQVSLLGPLFLLLYVNGMSQAIDMPQAVRFNLFYMKLIRAWRYNTKILKRLK